MCVCVCVCVCIVYVNISRIYSEILWKLHMNESGELLVNN